jgi:hypothetical protein
MLLEATEDFLYLLLIFFLSLEVDKDVIYIKYVGRVEERSINIGLEGS